MVVRIIDPNPHPSVVKQALCRNCGVKLEYTPADVSKRTVTDYTGSRETVCCIKCPSCGHKIATAAF
jgi:hypothetical protein